MAEIHVRPDSQDPQLVSQYYFYSDYNPSEHFTYNVVFKKDNSIDEIATLENQKKAYAKVIEYHFSFEQVLPKEDGGQYVRFYRPKIISENNVDYDARQHNFELITEDEFNTEIRDNQLEELVTKTMLISGDDGLAVDPATVEVAQNSRYMGEKDYSQLSIEELNALYIRWSLQSSYTNATEWNKYCYENAMYCYIKRPTRLSGNYVSPYDFRRVLRLVNTTFGFKLPIEEGWYRYNIYTRKWEYLNFKEEG